MRGERMNLLTCLDCCGRNVECPKACLVSGYNPGVVNECCMCPMTRSGRGNDESGADMLIGDDVEECFTSDEDFDMSFCFGDDEVRCERYNIAPLSRPFKAMLYGNFKEAKREMINFSQNGISADGMRAVEVYSRTMRLVSFDLSIVLELLSLANKFCCEELKSACCDAHLASLVNDMEDDVLLIEYGLEETT